MTVTTTVPLVHATGDPLELGRAHGTQRGEALRAFLADGLCRLDHLLPRPRSLAELRPTLDAFRREIAAATPDLAAEIDGLADGAGVSADAALLMQVRREILGYQRIPTMGDCTTYATAGSRPVLAQTVDLNGDLDDQVCVLNLGRRAGSRRVLVLSFGGLLGYLGLNSDGLAIGLNLVLGGVWRAGLPPYLAIRQLLDSAGSVAEAVRILPGLPLSSSRNLVLCDRETTAYVEILDGVARVEYAARTTHTNHFLHPDFARHDELNVFARNFSVQRLAACRQRLAELPDDAGVEEHFALLTRPPIRVGGDGDIRRERTVAAVVLRPDRGELHVRPGDPAGSDTQSFGL